MLNHHREERHFSSVDRALTGYKTRQNLAVLALDMGDLAEAERHWREVVRTVPYYRQGWRGLARPCCAPVDSPNWIRSPRISQPSPSCVSKACSSRAARRKPGALAAAGALDRPLPNGRTTGQRFARRGRFFFEHGTTDEADDALRALLDRRPDDASAIHNLGIVLTKARRFGEAVEAYRQSLRYRPNYAGTYLNLGYALRDSGRVDEAVTAWEQAARLAPNDRTALRGVDTVRARACPGGMCERGGTPRRAGRELVAGILAAPRSHGARSTSSALVVADLRSRTQEVEPWDLRATRCGRAVFRRLPRGCRLN